MVRENDEALVTNGGTRLSMEKLASMLWPVIIAGGLGKLIDFLIGKAGQARAKDFLLKWWMRFDEVKMRNFGREDALFAGQIIDRWFGKRIWNWRRVAGVC